MQFRSLHALFAVISEETGGFVIVLLTGGWSGQNDRLLGPGAVPPPRRLPSLFSVWRQRGKICTAALPGGLFPAQQGLQQHQLPPSCLPPARYPPHKTFRADAASYSILTQFLAQEGGVQTGPGGAELLTGAGSSSVGSFGKSLCGLPAFSLPEALSTGLEKTNQS